MGCSISRLRETPYAFGLTLACITDEDRPIGFPVVDGIYTILVLAESPSKPGCFERIGFTSIYGSVGDSISWAYNPVPWSDDDYTIVTII
jgi:hypothetical protein